MLLLKTSDFPNRVADFVREMSPEHWKQNNWHEKHIALHRVSNLIVYQLMLIN